VAGARPEARAAETLTWTPPYCQALLHWQDDRIEIAAIHPASELRCAKPRALRNSAGRCQSLMRTRRGPLGSRLNRPRSDLSCHHARKRLCNLWWECCAKNSLCFARCSPSQLRPLPRTSEYRLIVPLMRSSAPNDARVLLRAHERDIGIGAGPGGPSHPSALGVVSAAAGRDPPRVMSSVRSTCHRAC